LFPKIVSHSFHVSGFLFIKQFYLLLLWPRTDDKVIWGAIHSPVVGTLHDTFTLNGNKGGTIKLGFDGLLKPTSDRVRFWDR
jgi:hypothetical protein